VSRERFHGLCQVREDCIRRRREDEQDRERRRREDEQDRAKIFGDLAKYGIKNGNVKEKLKEEEKKDDGDENKEDAKYDDDEYD
jgi:hypothetical protein